MEKAKKKAIKIGVVVGLCAIAAGGSLYAIEFFTPRMVTESVKVVWKENGQCYVQTDDKFILNIGQCKGERGDIITATYDEKAKDRFRDIAPDIQDGP